MTPMAPACDGEPEPRRQSSGRPDVAVSQEHELSQRKRRMDVLRDRKSLSQLVSLVMDRSSARQVLAISTFVRMSGQTCWIGPISRLLIRTQYGLAQSQAEC